METLNKLHAFALRNYPKPLNSVISAAFLRTGKRIRLLYKHYSS